MKVKIFKKKRMLWLAAVVSTMIVLFTLWNSVRPTRIAFVNFRDWQVAEYLNAKQNRFITIDRLDIRNGLVPDFQQYDITILFGMGLKLDQAQKNAIQKAARKGRAFYVYASSSLENDLTNLRGDQLKTVSKYLENGGRQNLNAFLHYCRRNIHKKNFFSKTPTEPLETPDNFYFDPETGKKYTDFNTYDSTAYSSGRFVPSAPRVLLLTSNVSPENQATFGPFLSIIRAMQDKGLNVYAASGFGQRLQKIEKVKPHCILLFAHGRLAPGVAKKAQALLKKFNAPVFIPLVVHEPISEWQRKQQGMQGGMLGQSIVVPETDGGINPFVIGGLAPDDRGYQVFAPIEERVQRLTQMVHDYIKLQNLPNKEKKLAIVYYKGPGKNALVAEGLEVVPSLLNTLEHLQARGYQTGRIPNSADELAALIDSLGPVIGGYAKGAQSQFINRAGVTRIDADTLFNWMEHALRPELIDSVKSHYGPPPGEYLCGYDSLQNEYLALPAIHLGNILLLPQLMPAMGDDSFQLVHGVKIPPPYPYLATYLYARYGFDADALIHFGTHGSLEFTPFKQSALSSFDWADVLVGDRPHFYLYTINNIGEGIIAKRRSYADLVSYITPPFRQGKLYGTLKQTSRLIQQTENAQDPAVHAEGLELVRRKAIKAGLDKDLQLPDMHKPPLSKALFEKIHRYLLTVEAEKITEGLYTIGVPYTQRQIKNTIAQMFCDPLAWSRAELALLEGRTTRKKLQVPHLFEAQFRNQAFADIANIAAGQHIQLLDDSTLHYYEKLESIHGENAPNDIMEIMMSMADSSVKSLEDSTLTQDTLIEYLCSISADTDLKKWFLGLEDDEKFAKAASLLDSLTLTKVKKLAKAIPSMRSSVEQFEKPHVRQVIAHMQTINNNAYIFKLLQSDSVLAGRKLKQRQLHEQRIQQFSEKSYITAIDLGTKTAKLTNALPTMSADRIRELQKILKKTQSIPDNFWQDPRLSQRVRTLMTQNDHLEQLDSSLVILANHMQAIVKNEKKYIKAVETINGIKEAISQSLIGLQNSADFELAALVNALNGGYIQPSSGGDAVHNPSAIPTGKNLYGIDAESAPGQAAWEAGIKLADAMLKKLKEKNGVWPRKVAFTLWGGEFIRDRGATVAQILYLLGTEPVRNAVGRVYDVRLIPESELNRPRIDVIVQTSGQFRDIAATRLYLIDKAVKLAAEAQSQNHTNYIAESTLDAERVLKEKGLSPLKAREFSTVRVFGGINGNYGTGIMGLVESGDRYDSDSTIANQYLKNMGAIYTKDHWGEYQAGLLEAAVQNTDAVMHSRTSNVSGPLSLDHVYEFMGGLNTVIKKVTGHDPDGMFLDMRNQYNVQAVDAKEAIWTEARSTILNPAFIEPLTRGSASSAETFAEYIRNTFAWNVTKESVIDEALWDQYHETLIRDNLNLGLCEFFEKNNPYALQEISAVMLETVRKGMWSPDSSVIKELANLHVELVRRHKAGCSGFVCNNPKLKEMISNTVTPGNAKAYNKAIDAIRTSRASSQNAIVLRKETLPRTLIDMAKKNMLALGIIFIIVVLFIASYIYNRKRNHD